MKCYKCKEEMFPVCDTAWRKHRNGTISRKTEWICAECRIYIEVDVHDHGECKELDELLKEVEE